MPRKSTYPYGYTKCTGYCSEGVDWRKDDCKCRCSTGRNWKKKARRKAKEEIKEQVGE